MKRIIINESAFSNLFEEKMPFQTFYEDIVSFINGLLKDPIGAKPSENLESVGLTSPELRKKLWMNGIVKKKETIDEPYDEVTGNQTSAYHVRYSVPREKFKDKIRQLYNAEINER